MYELPLFINGRDVEGDHWTYVVRASDLTKETVATFNLKRGLELGTHTGPIPDAVAGRCAWGNRELCGTAVEAARAARVEYGLTPIEDRLEFARLCHKSFLAHLDTLIDLLVIEGHPRRLASWELSGVIRGCDDHTLEWYQRQFDSTHAGQSARVQLVRKPDGVVCLNPPQNAAGSNGALGVLALLAGNTLVVKAPRSTPLSIMYIYRHIVQPALDGIGAPPGTLNIISGQSREIMRDWIASPLVDDVLFFGGSDVGIKVGVDCVTAGKKPVLELSGNDGVVVWEDAEPRAAAAALSECFYGSAQICMVPKYALVHPRIADSVISELARIAREIKPGFPEDEGTLLSPVLKGHEFYDHLAQAKESNAEVVCGGRRIGVHGEPQDDGLFFEPTVLRIDGLARARELSCVTEETFFPLLPVVVVSDDDRPPGGDLLDAMIAFLNENRYGLRNSLWAKSTDVTERFARGVHNGGQLKINDSHISFHSYLATHGGTGLTGGPFGELNYVALRTSHLQGIVWGTGNVRPIDELVSGNDTEATSQEPAAVAAAGLGE